MRLLDKVWFALRGLTGRKQFEREMDEEVRHFLAMDAQQKAARGMAPDAAKRAARAEMGGVEQTKEGVRAMRPGVWLETLWQDLRFAARLLRKRPGYLAVALVTMALGIGANTAIFSVVHAVLLQPLPYRNADRLVMLHTEMRQQGRGPQLAYLDYLDVRTQHSGIEDATAFLIDAFIVTGKTGGDQRPARRLGLHATPSFFSTLGVQPAQGRAFLAEEAVEGRDRVAILSHRVWKESFGGRANALGETILLDRQPHTIVGVMPAGFDLYLPLTEAFAIRDTDIYVPLGPTHRRAQNRRVYTFEVLARLKSGVRRERAEMELKQIARGLAEKYPDSNSERTLAMTPMRDQIVGNVRPALLLLMGAVGVVLLAACVNLANLMIGRLAAREQELAMRAALGASRGRLVRQMLAESLLLVTLGGAAGVLLAWRMLPGLVSMVATRLPAGQTIGINAAALAFAVIVSVLAGIASGIVPARTLWVSGPGESLHGAGRTSASAGHSRMRKALVVAEIALSCVLLAGAGLLGSSLLALMRVDPGFNPASVVTFQVSLSDARYETRAQVARALTELTQRVAQLPGVVRATAAGSLPLSGQSANTAVWIEGRIPPVGQQPPSARWQYVQQGYFEAMGLPLLRGRPFEERDIERKPHVTMISESCARRDFPGEDPIGKRVSYGPPGNPPDWHEIIGVVGDVRHSTLRDAPTPHVYDLFGQHAGLSAFVAVRTAQNAEQVMTGARAILRQIDPGAPIYTARTMQEWMALSVNREQALAVLVGVFALAALFLGAVGAYGVIASLVEQRTREIGIRIALGASPGAILRATVGEGLQLAVLGSIVGLGASLGLEPLLRGMLFGVGATDPRTFAAVAALMLSVALAACYVPARRAAKVDPIIALRQE